METDMTDASSGTPTLTPAPARTGRHRRWLLGTGAFVAVLALMLFAGNAFGVSAQGPRGMGPGRMMPFGNGGNGSNGMMGAFGFGHGIRAVVTGVDTGANTITLAGLPQQITTVKVDNTVKLETLQTDGTTKPAAIGDFKSGTLVRIGIGRGNGSNGSAQPTGTPGANRGRFGFAINDLVIVPDNIAEVSGLVIANNNGTYTIAADGGLRLTVKTQGNTTYTGARNAAATAADVKVGTRIIVNGTQAPDGITATAVRVIDFSNFPMGNGNGANGNGGNGGNGPMPNAPRATPKATATT